MLSGPAALSGLRLDSNLCTPLTLTVIFGIVGNFLKDEDEIPLRFLKKERHDWDRVTGDIGVKTDWNCWFKTLAFS
ncbi:hypothetical protein DPMN_004106 [Dreissena polymorpha]|uniref:Uncharacterized protein n=1 Tax=Dreissena polymorpha TaxID=45954 RepID=A0A9D4MR70_DREPO|nr:hypothetical protein DPMN_004106 [Dreissena polymorpha]